MNFHGRVLIVRCSWLSCNVDDLTSQHCRYLARLMPLIREANTIVNGPDLFGQSDYYSKNKAVNEPYVRDQKLVGRIPFDEAGAPIGRLNTLKLDIENLNGDVVELTLRDEMACTFAKNVYDQMERPVFIAVSFCKLSKYREVEAIRDQYRAQLKLNPSLDISEERCLDLDQEKNRNRFALSTLLQKNPDGYRAVRFTCEGTIIGINTARDWYYQSCSKCIQKVIDGNGARECGDHGPQPEPTCPPGQAPYIFKWLWKKLTVTAEG
ncbi:replication protein A 70 kDa DNA-binding subunit [Tanacetum coccineum]